MPQHQGGQRANVVKNSSSPIGNFFENFQLFNTSGPGQMPMERGMPGQTPNANLDPKLYPKAVPGGYAMTPKHAQNSDGFADRTWLHPDLPGPKGNEVGSGSRSSGNPPLMPPAPAIDTTQAASTPIVTRSRDETYAAYLQQYGFDGEKAKAAADTRGDLGSAYRAGDPLAQRPALLRPGSDAYMQSEDMRIWAQANPELAKRLQERAAPREQRISDAEDRQYARLSGSTTGNPSNKVTFDQDPTEQWKNLTGTTQIVDYQTKAQNVDLVKATQKGIQKARQDIEVPQISGEKANVGGEMYDIEESAIIDIMDQNPGATRGQAIDMIQKGTLPPRGKDAISRVGMTGDQAPDYVLDMAMEQEGLQRNQAIDMPRSEEGFDHLTLGEHFTDPAKNRASAHMPLMRGTAQQATFTGTRSEGTMQPPSGLNDAYPVKVPLKYEQGNIAPRGDNDLQRNDDTIAANAFAIEATKALGKQLFGPDYSPFRALA